MAAVELETTRLKLLASLKAYFRFSTGALTTDSSGNGHTLTAISDPAEVDGKFGKAAGFDGNDAYSATDHADLKPTDVFGVGLWVKAPDQTALVGMVHSWSTNTNNAGFRLQMGNSGVVSFRTGRNTGTTLHTDYEIVNGATAFNDDAWHFVVGVWDGSHLRVYVDGEEDASPVAWANAPGYAATNYFRIACQNDTGTNGGFFTGVLDEIFIFNGYAPTADDIMGIFDGSIKTPIKSFSEMMAMSEIISKKPIKVITENARFSPIIIKKPVKVISNNLSIDETFSRKLTGIRAFVENLAITEVKSISRLLTKTFTENVAISEVFTKVGTFIRTLTENLSISELKKNTIIRNLTESLAITEIIDATSAKYWVVIDSISVSEVMVKKAVKNLTENLAITENLSKISTLIRSFTENLAITEVVAKFRLYRVALAESLAISEVLEKVGTFVRTFTENISIDESIASVKTYVRSLTENLAITESLSKLKTNFRAFTENLEIAEVFFKRFMSKANYLFGKIGSVLFSGKVDSEKEMGKIDDINFNGKIK
jgi:hypothetical protein